MATKLFVGHRIPLSLGTFVETGIAATLTYVPGSSGPHLSDTFTGAAAFFATHTMDTGAGWLNSSLFSVDGSGKAFNGDIMSTAFDFADAGVSDGTVSVEVFGVTNQLSLIGRYVDANNYWYVQWNSFSFGLFKIVAGILTQVDFTEGGDLAPANDYKLEIVFAGSSITANIYDSMASLLHTFSETDTDLQTATKFGLEADNYPGTGNTFDNFLVV